MTPRAGLHFTSHAAEQMDRRGIDAEDVAEALDRSDATYPGTDRRRENVVKEERTFGRLKNEYGLAPPRVRGLERVALHADLTMLARLAQALAPRGLYHSPLSG